MKDSSFGEGFLWRLDDVFHQLHHVIDAKPSVGSIFKQSFMKIL